MSSISSIITACTDAISAINAETLTSGNLDSSIDILRSFDVNDAIDSYWASLPEKPESENELPAWEKAMHQRGKEMNHQLRLFNNELSRLKNMQAALNLPPLDKLIHAAQEVIRPLYNFSAQLTQ